jgi:hypothetical protein
MTDRILFTLGGLLLVSVICSSYYIFYYKKNYDFLVEAPCSNSQSETCFTRDCESEEGCPPNNLSSYRIFHIKAVDFEKCVDDSCLSSCTTNQIKCTETKCDQNAGDSCSAKITE